jgi:hypothetical protein
MAPEKTEVLRIIAFMTFPPFALLDGDGARLFIANRRAADHHGGPV